MFSRTEELNKLPEETRNEMIKGLNPGWIETKKLTIDKILVLRTYDRSDKLTRADLWTIISYLLTYIEKMEA